MSESLLSLEDKTVREVNSLRGILHNYINKIGADGRSAFTTYMLLAKVYKEIKKINEKLDSAVGMPYGHHEPAPKISKGKKFQKLRKYAFKILLYLKDIMLHVQRKASYDLNYEDWVKDKNEKFLQSADKWKRELNEIYGNSFCSICKLPKVEGIKPFCIFCNKNTEKIRDFKGEFEQQRESQKQLLKSLAGEAERKPWQSTNPFATTVPIGKLNRRLIDITKDQSRPFQYYLRGFLAPSCCGIVINSLTDNVEKWDKKLTKRRRNKLLEVIEKLKKEGKQKAVVVLGMLEKKLSDALLEKKTTNDEYNEEEVLKELKKELNIPEEHPEKDPFIYYLSPETHNKKGEIKEEDYYNNLVAINPEYNFSVPSSTTVNEAVVTTTSTPKTVKRSAFMSTGKAGKSRLFIPTMGIQRSLSHSIAEQEGRPRTPLKKKRSADDEDIEYVDSPFYEPKARSDSVMSETISVPTAPPGTPSFVELLANEELPSFDLQSIDEDDPDNKLVRRKSVGFRSTPEILEAEGTGEVPTPARRPKISSVAYARAKRNEKRRKKEGGKKRTRKRRNKKRKKTRKRIYFKDLL